MASDRVVVHLRLPRDLAARIKAQAEREGRSITKLIERALAKALGKGARR